MEFLRDVGHVESYFGPFGCKIGAQFRPNITYAQKSFGTNPMELLGDVGHVECHFGPFGDVVSVRQNRCMVCAKHTIGSEIILDAPDGTPSL
jgi:hypothetical protein